MDYIKAFLIGGVICMMVQILMDKTKLMPGRIMVLLVVSGSVLGFLGIYEPFAQWAGAGATVPKPRRDRLRRRRRGSPPCAESR